MTGLRAPAPGRGHVSGLFGDLPGQDAVVAQLTKAAAAASALLAGQRPNPAR